jgi:hypothetical protein
MRRNRSLGAGDLADSNFSLMDILGNSLGGVLFLLILVMVIMVLLPKTMADWKHLKIHPEGDVVELPAAVIGEEYRLPISTQGGNEFVDLELASGSELLPNGLRWMVATHGDEGEPEGSPSHRTRVGICGTPECLPGEYVFTIVARAKRPFGMKDEQWEEMDPKDKVSPPKTFKLRVLSPAVERLDSVEPLRFLDASLKPTRLPREGYPTVRIGVRGGLKPYQWRIASRQDVLHVSDEGMVTAKVTSPAVFEFTVAVSCRPAMEEVLGGPTGVGGGPSVLLMAAALSEGKVECEKKFIWRVLPRYDELAIQTPEVLPDIVGGERCRIALAAKGGTGAYRWKVFPSLGGVLPEWIRQEEGYLEMEPPKDAYASEPYALRIEVRDGDPKGKPAGKLVKVKVNPMPLVTVASPDGASKLGTTMKKVLSTATSGEPRPLPRKLRIVTDGELQPSLAGAAYRLTLAAEGGQSPYRWSIKGDLPEGVDLKEGTIAGTPEEGHEGRHGFRALVLDSQNPPDSARKEMVLSVEKAETDDLAWWQRWYVVLALAVTAAIAVIVVIALLINMPAAATAAATADPATQGRHDRDT